jgi:8-oxo-dGTP pyrophosphatase MutT (NUDIX family)
MQDKVGIDPKNYHEDEGSRVEGERYAGIVITDHKVLLIHRIKDGFEYYVFPGGHRRQEETREACVLREITEETSLKVQNPKLVFEFKDHHNQGTDFYYLCECDSCGKPKLVGEEKIRNCEENFYEPMWVELSKISELNILPLFAKEWLARNIHLLNLSQSGAPILPKKKSKAPLFCIGLPRKR